MPPSAVAKLLTLPERERLEIAELLWLSVAEESMGIPAEHKQVVDQRLTDYKSGKIKTVSHAELLRRVRGS